MDTKNLIRLADAAERAGITVPDVLALCTEGDDLHLDIYVVPPSSGWAGEEWYEEDHLDLPHPDGHGYEGKDEPVKPTVITSPIVLPVGALRSSADDGSQAALGAPGFPQGGTRSPAAADG